MFVFFTKVGKYINNLKIHVQVNILLILFNTLYIKTDHKKEPGIIYILTWTNKHTYPYGFWSRGRKSLELMNCEYQNCYLVDETDYFHDLTDYDVILFNAVEIHDSYINVPPIRSDNQIYVFVSLESATNYPITDERFNSFFNYTWTYKLNSDIVYPYLIIRNKSGTVIGPKPRMRWMKAANMAPISETIKERLENKITAAAWFVSNCWARNHRLEYIHGIRIALSKYHLALDIYGGCGERKCPQKSFDECLALIERDYYFYLAFENSFSEDYVTEKLMYALDHYAVPVVFGGADYFRYKYYFICFVYNWLKPEEKLH